MARIDPKRWIRWFSARGVPPGHIARVLRCEEGDVAEALRTRHGHTIHHIDAETGATIGRMRSEGRSFPAIAAELGLPWYAVKWYRQHGRKYRPRVPDRPPGAGALRGPTAGKARRFADLGYPAARVAELLGLDPAAVERFLLPPAMRLVRVAWSSLHGPEWRDESAGRVGAIEATAAAELAAVEVPGPSIAEAPPPIAEAWGSAHASTASGGLHPNAALTDAEAAEARELRAAGVPRAELARRFGVSVATITRITSRVTYPVPVPPVPDPDPPPPPTIAAAESPPAATWTEPRRRGRAWRDD